jgi:hypothetical protein
LTPVLLPQAKISELIEIRFLKIMPQKVNQAWDDIVVNEKEDLLSFKVTKGNTNSRVLA